VLGAERIVNCEPPSWSVKTPIRSQHFWRAREGMADFPFETLVEKQSFLQKPKIELIFNTTIVFGMNKQLGSWMKNLQPY